MIQVSSSLREVFEEEEPTPSDPNAQLSLAKSKVDQLNVTVEEQKKEIQRVKERCQELIEQKEVKSS